MTIRLRPVERGAVGLFLIAGLIAVPSFGWAPFLTMSLAAVVFLVIQSRVAHYRRPEYALAGCWLFAQLMVALGFALAGGPRVFMLSAFAFPVMLGSVVFPLRSVVFGTALSTGLVVSVAFGFAHEMVLATPPVLIYPVVTLICTAIWASAARDADIASRSTAIIDELTGTLNRSALAPRAAELAYQGTVTNEGVAVIVGDIDCFKSINDQHGHATGDAVLREVADRMRQCLGPFESIYRVGGEEFVVLLAGADGNAAADVAERLRIAVSEEPLLGLSVTMSFGVAASTPGEVFDYEAVFGLADAALYEAKCEGRDRVCLGTASVAQAAVSSSRDGRGRSMGSPGSLRRRRRDLALVGDGGAGRPRWNDRVVGEPARKGSWLIKDELQREHMLDLLRRIDRVGHAGNALVLTGLLAAGPSYGWIPIVPALVAGVLFQVIESSLERFRRPEFALGIGWVIASLGYAVACFFASAPPLAALPLLVLMNVGFSAVFPPRAVILGGAVQALLITGVAFGTAGTETLNDPAILVFPLALLGAVALIGTVVGQSAREHRGVAVVDQLTGVLNRTALDARAAELAHQASVMRGHVALVVGDLDHFKSINDRHGHATGDEVLRVVAQRLRTHLRAFEPLYRFGGEEFVVLLPGMDLTGAMAIAERLADSVRGEAVSGVPVTMSFGVAGIAPGEPFEFEALFDLADRALYDAKQDGRDRVRAEGRGRSLETLAA